jgi:hypothetical protein
MRVTGAVLVAAALLVATACGTDRSGTPGAGGTFDPDDGCSLAVGPFAISSEYIRSEDMWGRLPDGPAPTYGPVEGGVLSELELPSTLGGLAAQTMHRGDGRLVVFYGDAPVSSGFQSDLTATGGLVLALEPTGMTDRQSLRNMVDLVGDRVTEVQIGTSVGWASQVDGDHEGARSRPQQVRWVEGHHQFAVVGVRDPAELVVTARQMVCPQAS